jgi:hypothetical protein
MDTGYINHEDNKFINYVSLTLLRTEPVEESACKISDLRLTARVKNNASSELSRKWRENDMLKQCRAPTSPDARRVMDQIRNQQVQIWRSQGPLLFIKSFVCKACHPLPCMRSITPCATGLTRILRLDAGSLVLTNTRVHCRTRVDRLHLSSPPGFRQFACETRCDTTSCRHICSPRDSTAIDVVAQP